jgi:hypothetical protein
MNVRLVLSDNSQWFPDGDEPHVLRIVESQIDTEKQEVVLTVKIVTLKEETLGETN